MERTIREIIIENIKNEEICSEEEIIKRMAQVEKQPLDSCKLFNSHFNKMLKDENINTTKDFFNLTIDEANSIFKIGLILTKNYIKSMSNKMVKAILRLKKHKIEKTKAETNHPKLENLVQRIKKSEKMSKYLKEDMIHRENYNTLNPIEKINARKFINTKLELNTEELNMLRKYLLNEITQETIEQSKNKYKSYEQITKIYEELCYFIKKIQYKEILSLNYKTLEELDLCTSDINALKRNNITSINDLIDFSEKEMLKLPMIGKMSCLRILYSLGEKNIILLSDKQQLKENLKCENFNIVKPKKNQK